MSVSAGQNHATLRCSNKRAILEYLCSAGSASRAELARALRLSKPAVSDHLSALLACGLVSETGRGASTQAGGRKPVLLSFNPTYRYILTVHLKRKALHLILCDLYGHRKNALSLRFPTGAGADAGLQSALSSCEAFLSSSQITPEDLCYIAVSSPGIFSPDHPSDITSSGPLPLEIPAFLSHLRERFRQPVLIRNDVKAATVGELYFGAGRQSQDCLYLHCGEGLGAGIVLNRELLEGQGHAVGEIYNFIPGVTPEEKNLEALVNIPFLLQALTEAMLAGEHSILEGIIQNHNSIAFEDVITAYRAQDPLVLRQLRQIAVTLGCQVANIVNLLSLDTVVFSGEYLAFSDLFTETFSEIAARRCHTAPRVCVSALTGTDAETYGLFHFARTAYFDLLCRPEADAFSI